VIPMPDIFDQYTHQRPTFQPMIYAYSDANPEYKGLLKVGYTAVDIDKRVAQQYPVKRPDGSSPYSIVVRESAMYSDGTSFTDHDVHRILKKKHFECVGGEWYRCTAKDVVSAVIAVRSHTLNIENRTQTFSMRPEQRDAVEKTVAYFQDEKENHTGSVPKFLWNAKMRFGKTFTMYQLAKRLGLKMILVLTFKPAVESAWEEDLNSHVDFKGWQFYSNKTKIETGLTPDQLDQSRPIVCFGSFQDFLGTNSAGGIKVKNEWVHSTNWDIVVFDEYHFGAWRENARKLFEREDEDAYDSLDMEKYQTEEAGNAYNETFIPITTNYYLFLSGTPFRALNSGEFIEEQIYNWTYSDEQRAKEYWVAPPDNPYASLPRMVMMTYQIPPEIQQVALKGEFNEFDLNLFFSATGNGEDAQFVYEDYVQKWLDLIRGAYMPTSTDALKLGNNQKPALPYSDVRLLNVLTHTLWFLPNVASCEAMANLLAKRQNSFYHDYEVNVCAGSRAGIGLDALAPIEKSMANPLNTKTITLSCGKLTTGVTIRPWTGIFMLRNLSSPETYFQAAFRVQSPWVIKTDDGQDVIMKRECYVFDFALNRALREIADYSRNLDISEANPEKKVGEFLSFLPVLAYYDGRMTPIDAAGVLDITFSGTSATLLAKRWESALLVNVDNATLQRLMDNPDAMKALMNIEGFRNLNADIETIINKSNAVKKAKKDGGDDLTSRQKRELTEEEKEYKSKRKEIQEKLMKFATRIPIFMYLTDFREYTLRDVITKIEPDLFKKVTGLTVKDFDLLLSLGLFNNSLMNSAVYNFKRYEDASLAYSGMNKHADDERVGLFSTTITRADYDKMAKEQGLSMTASTPVPTSSSTGSTSATKPAVEKPIPARKVPAKEQPVSRSPKAIPQHSQPSKTAKADLTKIVLGASVCHKKFGDGEIIEKHDNKVIVRFHDGEKMFITPSAFEMGLLEINTNQ